MEASDYFNQDIMIVDFIKLALVMQAIMKDHIDDQMWAQRY